MVLPSSYEEYSGKIKDPTGHDDEIDKSTEILYGFVLDMKSNRVPTATMDMLIEATETLGEFAGYPQDTADVISFLDIVGSKSYQDSANLIEEYLKKMKLLFEERKVESTRPSATQALDSLAESNDKEVPF